MKTAICPGSFDPVTIGHIEVIRRAAKLFDKVIVVVMINYHKPAGYFTVDERVELLKRSLTDIDNVEIETNSGLLAEYAKEKGACAVVKGLRAVSDFEYEFQMAQANRKLCYKAETIFLTAKSENTYLSSSMVKQIAMFGGDVSDFVPECILDKITNRLKKN